MSVLVANKFMFIFLKQFLIRVKCYLKCFDFLWKMFAYLQFLYLLANKPVFPSVLIGLKTNTLKIIISYSENLKDTMGVKFLVKGNT
jgi:hypothetical protein